MDVGCLFRMDWFYVKKKKMEDVGIGSLSVHQLEFILNWPRLTGC